MSELLPKIARIARLLPQEDGRSDHADAVRRLQKSDVAVTQPLSFSLYTKIPATGERVNWKVQSGFPSEYFASHSITFKHESMGRNTAILPVKAHNCWSQRINLTLLLRCPRAQLRNKPSLY